MIKKLLLLALSVSLSASVAAQDFGPSVRKAAKLTEKGYPDKKTVFDPAALQALLETDDYVMLISSFEGCIACEWIRQSDVFDLYPVSPYYNDMLLNEANATIPYVFFGTGFPTCAIFNKKGEIVSITVGAKDYYEKLDKIVAGETVMEHDRIPGLAEDDKLPYFNALYKANAAYLKGDMETMREYAAESMAILPTFYNRYLQYKYHLSRNETDVAEEYKTAMLEAPSPLEEIVFKKLIAELKK